MSHKTIRHRAAKCNSMEEVRAGIDAIDVALVDLLAERAAFVDRAWRLKQRGGGQALVQWRVDEVLAKVQAQAEEKGLPPELAEALWRQMMEWFIHYESKKLENHRKGRE